MTVKEHYDNHLGNFYTWMIGDIGAKMLEFQEFVLQNNLLPTSSGRAIDLGAGNGIQSIPLARLGYTVTAVDFNQTLLDELSQSSEGLDIDIRLQDIRDTELWASLEPELMVCCGDTLAHLENWQEVNAFIQSLAQALNKGGKSLLSFRDYSNELIGDQRFIPVKQDENRILTCILDYEVDKVRVTDLLYEKNAENWVASISSYVKVRISSDEILKIMEKHGFHIQLCSVIQRMTYIIGVKI